MIMNIFLIPTDRPSRLFLNKANNKLLLDSDTYSNLEKILPSSKYQHIYITSSEEIREGDKDFYIIANDRDKTWINRIEKVIECVIDPKHGKVLILSSGFIYIDEGCKIILTTDPDLIKDGVQPIDNEFLEWFVKNPSCEFVEVERIIIVDTIPRKSLYDYKIIFPQELKQECCKEVSGAYLGTTCPICYKPFRSVIQEPKKETLKESDGKGVEVKLSDWGENEKFKQVLMEIRKTPMTFVPDERKFSEQEVLDAWELGAKEGLPLTKKKKEKLFKQLKNDNYGNK